jgi:phospholipase/lecithinase/hemolysin
MKKLHVLTTALAAAAFLAGCGGNDAGDQPPRANLTQVVSFGDSLSDVGTYNVGVVKAQGGGHYSINGQGATGLPYINWTEFLAATLETSQPCAAETGLTPVAPFVPTLGDETPKFHDASTGGTCANYAQGGARVTADVGPGNAALLNPAVSSTYGDAIGQLTIPVQKQINNYLAHNGGAFRANQLVTVFAGGNDIFSNVGGITAGLETPTQAVAAMTQAGADLANYVNTLILAKGATHVVVLTLPDVSLTPYALGADAVSPGSAALVKQMTVAFNTELQKDLTASDSLVVVDVFAASEDQAAHPAQYGLSDVTHPACDLTKVGSSLVCTKATLISALLPTPATAPASAANGFEYADSVHPTPFGYSLLATLVEENLAIKGWL